MQAGDWLYQRTGRYFAAVAEGLEQLAAEELSGLGCSDVSPAFRGLHFTSGKAALYSADYRSRLVTRILAPLITFDCHSTKYLYKTAREIEWPSLFTVDKTFAITSNVSDSAVTHSQYASLVLKDAIVDCFREAGGRRPDVEKQSPDVWIDLFLQHNHATISIDTSGGSLHRRGYRIEGGSAPMQETVAAAAVTMSGWDGEQPLYDPMCGSGTLLAEAHMSYCRIPAAFLRQRFGFQNLPDFEPGTWAAVRAEADSHMRKLPEGLIRGSDISRESAELARKNLSGLPFGDRVRIRASAFHDLEGLEGYAILTNPPYGIRMGNSAEVEGLMKEFGDFLKQRCKGSKAFIYFGNRNMLKHIGLRTAWKKPLRNGQLEGRLAAFDLY
jgi:putative N6-adenine-specific DNA methylase